jgi:hypothetical protein
VRGGGGRAPAFTDLFDEPPQGQPVVAALGHAAVPYRLIGRSADVGFITPLLAEEWCGRATA